MAIISAASSETWLGAEITFLHFQSIGTHEKKVCHFVTGKVMEVREEIGSPSKLRDWKFNVSLKSLATVRSSVIYDR